MEVVRVSGGYHALALMRKNHRGIKLVIDPSVWKLLLFGQLLRERNILADVLKAQVE